MTKRMDFRFPHLFNGLEVIPKAGAMLATGGAQTWKTAWDDCLMAMPFLRHVKPGATVLRLGRYE